MGPITYEIAQCATALEDTSWSLQLVHMAAGVNTNFQVLLNLYNSDYPSMGDLVGNSITLAEEFGDGGATTMSSSIDDTWLQSSPPTLFIESISDEGGVVGCLYNMADYVSNIDTIVTVDGPLLFACD